MLCYVKSMWVKKLRVSASGTLRLFQATCQKTERVSKQRMIYYWVHCIVENNSSRRTKSILQCSDVQTRDKTHGILLRTWPRFALSPSLTQHDANGSSFMDYEANAKAIIQGYMNGAVGNILDTLGVLLDLPRARNLTWAFSCHQTKVGEQIRNTILKEMELALEMELKAAITNEEDKEYYEAWVKSDRKPGKNSDSLYCTAWDGSDVQVETIMLAYLVMVFLLVYIHVV